MAMIADPIPHACDRCGHAEQELRRRFDGKKNHFFMQCMRCGVEVEAVKGSDPLVMNLADLPPEKDRTLAMRYWTSREAITRLRETYAEEDRYLEKRPGYPEYIESADWRKKRQMRLEIDRCRCTARMEGCTGVATQVHHLTYKHLLDEPIFDLRSVCKSCHDRITATERWLKEACRE